MAAKFKATITPVGKLVKKLESLDDGLTQSQAKGLAATVTGKMKSLILKGISPVEGIAPSGKRVGGRFPRYKDPKKYPGKLKSSRPVNLKLTGEQLRNLRGGATRGGKDGFGAKIFYRSQLSKLKEEGHSKGANKQPSRPTIPNPPLLNFAQPIQVEINKFFTRVIGSRVRKKT